MCILFMYDLCFLSMILIDLSVIITGEGWVIDRVGEVPLSDFGKTWRCRWRSTQIRFAERIYLKVLIRTKRNTWSYALYIYWNFQISVGKVPRFSYILGGTYILCNAGGWARNTKLSTFNDPLLSNDFWETPYMIFMSNWAASINSQNISWRGS